ncbi:HEXXH motif domain-containing protein [Streptomyces chumphonensis]|uniref:HEXXH motif domain-containing protein n=1 Tax=Streptomyces chumphonensis TaxID=1214925 RepID=A0A927IET0_9ACTN|nr:HEXXH motif-containing putative peptide modification protein [Streptomyces chumphonensis]MBD3933691.1 hypothetical protein [Streptomyces chumphonensis]
MAATGVTEPTRLPGPALARLATTRPVPGDLALLHRAVEDRRLVLLKALHTRLRRYPDAVRPEARRAFAFHWALLARAESRHPRAARAALGYPTVGARLVAALRAPDGIGLERALTAFGATASAVALRTGTSFSAELATEGGVLALPGVGVFHTTAPWVRLTARRGAAWLAPPRRPGGAVLLRLPARSGGAPGPILAGGGPGWRQPRRLPGAGVWLEDVDPYRVPAGGVGLPTGTPHTAADRVEVGAYPWADRWRAALAVLLTADPLRALEARSLLRAVVPLGATPHDGPAAAGGRLSATTRAAPGALLTTRPGSPAELAAVIVHETHHTELDLVDDLVPLLHDATGPSEALRLPTGAGGALHTVGWRADPRPVRGVLHGTYAHLALADLWARLARGTTAPAHVREAARERYERCWEQVGQALPVLLNSSELTYAGREFAIGMSEYHRSLGNRPGIPHG